LRFLGKCVAPFFTLCVFPYADDGEDVKYSSLGTGTLAFDRYPFQPVMHLRSDSIAFFALHVDRVDL